MDFLRFQAVWSAETKFIFVFGPVSIHFSILNALIFLLVFADPKKHKAIIGGLKNLLHVPIKFERSGSRVVLYEPDMMDE